MAAPLVKLCIVANVADAHLLTALLEQEGIAAVVRGDGFVPLQGGSLFRMETRPSVWVLDDDGLERAKELAGEFGQEAGGADAPSWRCRCGETSEAQFSECWNCGRPKPPVPSAA